MAVLVTGATGHLGPHLIAELLASARFDRVFVVARSSGSEPAARRVQAIERIARTSLTARGIQDAGGHVIAIDGTLDGDRLGLSDRDAAHLANQVDVIIHAAADTRFAAPLDVLRRSNADGTRAVCDFAARCARLRQLLFVSTACVAGQRVGRIPEQVLDAPGFVNAYEQTKWEAERIVTASGLPSRIARLTTCVGGHHAGYVHRSGAIHHLLHWIARGLVPMVPGSDESRIDLISTDVAAAWLARVAVQDPVDVDVCHVALGGSAIPLDMLLDHVVTELARTGSAARVTRPLVVDHETFRSFQAMVRSSGDALFARVQESASAMLPTLLYPKVFETRSAEACWGGPLPHPDWRSLVSMLVAATVERTPALARV